MKWSWRIGRIAGIDVYMHATFLILLAWVGISHYVAHQDVGHALRGMAFIITLFGVVVLHELGHALAARRYGIRTRDITLLPIGGVARLERIPDKPSQELVVALAGPAVNVVLAAGLYVVITLVDQLESLAQVPEIGGSFLNELLWANVLLAVFNMLPAFPMDGGRVLRALLATRMPHVQATQIASAVGQAMALLFGFLGLLGGQPLLIFVALFVWLAAAQEASMVQMRSALSGIPVHHAMVTDFRTLRPDDPLSTAVAHVLDGFQQDFPVVDGDQVVGVLTRGDIVSGLSQFGQQAPVGQVMQREFAVADAQEMLDTAFARLQACACHTLPVLRNHDLVGLLTSDNLGEYMMIQTALEAARGRRRV
jgi:Zn-dependent protease